MFLSYTGDCLKVDLFPGTGPNQAFAFEETDEPGVFHLMTKCGLYLSYVGDCQVNTGVDTWPQAGINQKFRFQMQEGLGWSISAVGRERCNERYLAPAAEHQTTMAEMPCIWYAHVRSSHLRKSRATRGGCADPFAWLSSDGTYRLVCTGGDLPLYQSHSLESGPFKHDGVLLGGAKPPWARAPSRWAPENVEIGTSLNVAVFSDKTRDGRQRVGWALSRAGVASGGWSTYSEQELDLGRAPGGEIDAHIFTDSNGQRYIVWKTDDNAVGSPTTRIWAQACVVDGNGVTLQGPRRVIMDSTGLWWIDSWVPGGSLVEGPEVVRRGAFYYLFFAAGRFCQDSYAEGVARARNIWGPYEKLRVPLLSTGMLGRGEDGPLIGPGHASFLQGSSGAWHAVWHASEGHNCNRRAYADRLEWTTDGWPYVDFSESGSLSFNDSIIIYA